MSNNKKINPISKIGRAKQIGKRILDKIFGTTKNSLTSKVELVNKTIDFGKGIIRKTYKITIVIYKSDIVPNVLSFSLVFLVSFRLRFGFLNPVEPVIKTPTQIERHLGKLLSTEELEFPYEEYYKSISLVKSDNPSKTAPSIAGSNRSPAQSRSHSHNFRSAPVPNPYRRAPSLVRHNYHGGPDGGGKPNGGGSSGGDFGKKDGFCYRTQAPDKNQIPAHVSFSNRQKKQIISKMKPRGKNRKKWSQKDKKRLMEDKKLWELAYDLHAETITPDLFDEAVGILQVQSEFPDFQIADVRRPYEGEGTTDFVLISNFYDRADTKTPVERFDNGKKIPRDVFLHLARESGKKAIIQKNGSETVLHVLNL